MEKFMTPGKVPKKSLIIYCCNYRVECCVEAHALSFIVFTKKEMGQIFLDVNLIR